MKKIRIITLILALLAMFFLCGCGENDPAADSGNPPPSHNQDNQTTPNTNNDSTQPSSSSDIIQPSSSSDLPPIPDPVTPDPAPNVRADVKAIIDGLEQDAVALADFLTSYQASSAQDKDKNFDQYTSALSDLDCVFYEWLQIPGLELSADETAYYDQLSLKTFEIFSFWGAIPELPSDDPEEFLPDINIRPEIKDYIDSLEQHAMECSDYIAGYNSSSLEDQLKDYDTFINVLIGLEEISYEWVLIPDMGLTPEENEYYDTISANIYSILDAWSPFFELLYNPPQPQPDPLPQDMEDILLSIEQMYKNTYNRLTQASNNMLPQITSYALYTKNHDALIAFYTDMTDTFIQDGLTMRNQAIEFYKKAALLDNDAQNNAMNAFVTRVVKARTACVDTFFYEQQTLYYDYVYVNFISDAWQGDIPINQWYEIKIPPYNEYYDYWWAILNAEHPDDFHQAVLDGFASGNFDVDGLMAVNN